ncbi:acyl-CoA dehydrogenase [Xanthomonas oryzae pv. oryzae]|nr:acyl-CoA dehydrogenase [Xanthomonas oryzae]AOS02310.1 acyl-CoA dehydrogenase [Xanthomonas oryzae pv. oryzae]AOS18952.1 acyl-CoA dehydrogenase [Xanthomonas oryzae pv. oryzae]AOS23117.1 acyl-CoA dehydrogenase [Xanthomonas oryzae pv. oryzae]AOS27239.1 acyl-CoA dehydrogenase [Xanthomonas oryzae pv. oryzae]AOS30925.1 acyl-CoA dehydrogenase [Xanthomonas oryzae pv. oryzae]
MHAALQRCRRARQRWSALRDATITEIYEGTLVIRRMVMTRGGNGLR